MGIDFPERPEAHQLATESECFFRAQLPREWTCDSPENDYGVDFRVGIVTDGKVRGRGLLVQLKSSAVAEEGEAVLVRLQVSTVNYLGEMLEVALLVKYVAADREAYWLLWKDIPAVPENQETMTVRIPRANRLSQNPWPQIMQHVENVHERKLAAMRRLGLNAG